MTGRISLPVGASTAHDVPAKQEGKQMTDLSTPSYPPLVGELRDRLTQSMFRSLAEPIETLATEYGATYLDDFEVHLQLLCDAFPERPWPDWAALGFLGLNKEILKEEMSFRQTGQYSATGSDLDKVAADVYHNPDVMDRYYLVGLYDTYFLWPHHFRLLQFYRQQFLKTGDPPSHIMEWGVGHGLLTLEAMQWWPQSVAAIVDLSAYSLQFANRLLATAGLGERVSSQEGDILQLQDCPKTDRLICSELLEHVPRPDLLLQRVRQALADGGLAYLTGAINAPQPDHVYLFRSDQELLRMIEEQGLTVNAHLTVCHPNRAAQSNPPAVVAMVVSLAN